MIAVYDKLIYFNEASKYTILRMRTDDPSVPEEARSQYTFRDRMLRFTAVGYGLPQTDSVKLEIEGDWKEGKYGLQLHVEHWHELVPPTTEGLLSYLSSGLLKGIGESTARSIVQRFGTDTLDVLEFHPEKLLEIRGITEQKLEEIKTCYAESRAMRDIMELLTPFQVTPVTAMKIYQHFGPACTDILRQSPFRLCEISGFGFRRVDTIIRKSGGDPHDPVRIHGAMICALENARQHGHLYLEVNALITESMQFLNEPIPLPQMQVRRAEVEQKLQQMAEDNEIVSDGGRLYLPHIFMQEVETAAKAAAMLMESTEKIDVTLPLEQVKQKLGLHLTKRQSRGVEVAMERNLSIITGGPGTGKTTVLKAIIEVYRILHPKNRIVLAAPTGKASRRMAQSTGMLDALTLHSLLGLQGDFCSKDKQDKPLQVDFLIVDEASMVDMWLAHQLFTRLQKDTKLLLLGDVDQLESVGAGNVFAELIGSGIVPVTVLDEIFRQSKDSLIAYNAKFINEENSSLFYGPDFQFVKAENQEEAAAQIQELYLRELQDTSIGQLQIISPYRTDGEASSNGLNALIRETVNPHTEKIPELAFGERIFRLHDRVMQTKNNYSLEGYDSACKQKFKGVFNGDIGSICKILPDKLCVDYDGRIVEYSKSQLGDLESAYAITIHKSMGSEYETVIIPILMAHRILLTKNLIYTAVTRAKKRVILVGQKRALFLAIHSGRKVKRNTCLAERILKYTGVYVIGKRAVLEVGGTRSRLKDRGSWYIIPDHHPAIVEKAVFDTVQASQLRFSQPNKKKRDYPLKGKAFCGYCGHALSRTMQKTSYYYCRHSEADVESRCYKMRLNAAELEQAVFLTLKKQMEAAAPLAPDGTLRVDASVPERTEYEQQIEALQDGKRALYERYLMGEIDLNTYKAEKAACDELLLKTKNAYAAVLAQAKQKQDEQARQDSRKEASKAIFDADTLTTELAELLIDRVLVYPDKRIEIAYKIQDIFD